MLDCGTGTAWVSCGASTYNNTGGRGGPSGGHGSAGGGTSGGGSTGGGNYASASPSGNVVQAVPAAGQKEKCGWFAPVCNGWQRSMEWIHENRDTLGHIALDLAEIDGGLLLIQEGPTIAVGGGFVLEIGSGGTATVIAIPAAALGVTAVAGGGALAVHGASNLGKHAGDLHWNNQATGSGGAESSDKVGASRETKVAEITGGRIPSGEPGKPGMKITQPGVGSSDVDVIGRNGEYIAVGGPAKARNLSKLGQKLHILKYAAGEAKVPAQAYFEEGTPQPALDLANRILGSENVFTFGR
jgi:hypothetical protein